MKLEIGGISDCVIISPRDKLRCEIWQALKESGLPAFYHQMDRLPPQELCHKTGPVVESAETAVNLFQAQVPEFVYVAKKELDSMTNAKSLQEFKELYLKLNFLLNEIRTFMI